MKLEGKGRLIAAAALLAILLAGCSSAGGTSSAPSGGTTAHVGGTVTIGTNTDVYTFDPAKCGLGEGPQCAAVFGTLLIFDSASKKFVPRMAKSFVSSKDGLEWTLKLRPNVKFSDGTPFNADAVIFNWNRIIDPATGSPSAALASTIAWHKVDDLTINLDLKQPNYQLPWALTYSFGMIGSPAGIKAAGANVGTTPVGAGPFVLANWAHQSEMKFTRNPKYWDSPRPYLDNLNFKIITADDLRADALRNNEIQIDLGYVGKVAHQLVGEGFVDAVDPAFVGSGLQMSAALPFVKDPDVRLAFAKLLDAKQIVDALYPEEVIPKKLIGDGLPFSNSVSLPKHDVAGAQKLIDAYLKRTGQKSITVNFEYAANSTLVGQLAVLVQAQLEKAKGVTVTVTPLDPAAESAAAAAGKVAIEQGGIFGSNPDALYDTFHSGGALNSSHYSSPALDKQLELTRSAPTVAERDAAYSKAVDLISSANLLIPYRRTDTHWTHAANVHGVIARDSIQLDVDQISISK